MCSNTLWQSYAVLYFIDFRSIHIWQKHTIKHPVWHEKIQNFTENILNKLKNLPATSVVVHLCLFINLFFDWFSDIMTVCFRTFYFLYVLACVYWTWNQL